MYPRLLQKFDNTIIKLVNKYANFRWYNSPLTKKILAGKDEYLKIWHEAKLKKYQVVDDFELKAGYKIDINWYDELALHTQVVIKKSEICYVHGRLLYASLRSFIKKSKLSTINIFETGTALGFSALCLAKAIDDAQICGKIVTFDVLPHNFKMFWNCIDDNDSKKTRAELLKSYNSLTEKYIFFHQGNTKIELPKMQTDRVHYAFLDSAHDYHYLKSEFMNIKDKQLKGDTIFFDDYSPKMFPGVVKAVDEICEKYNYSKKALKISDARAYVIAEKL